MILIWSSFLTSKIGLIKMTNETIYGYGKMTDTQLGEALAGVQSLHATTLGVKLKAILHRRMQAITQVQAERLTRD
jgi:hypothetical protein